MSNKAAAFSLTGQHVTFCCYYSRKYRIWAILYKMELKWLYYLDNRKKFFWSIYGKKSNSTLHISLSNNT